MWALLACPSLAWLAGQMMDATLASGAMARNDLLCLLHFLAWEVSLQFPVRAEGVLDWIGNALGALPRAGVMQKHHAHDVFVWIAQSEALVAPRSHLPDVLK
jgi:hypothetical protein